MMCRFLSLYFLIAIARFASAAVLPPLISPSNTTVPTHLQSANFSTSPALPSSGQIHCVVPAPYPVDPVSLQTCQRTIHRLLNHPWSDTPRPYTTNPNRRVPIYITRDRGCAISLDYRAREGEILISLSQIVRVVVRTLLFCSGYGEGGWQFLEPPWNGWIVIVQGSADRRFDKRDGSSGAGEHAGLE